MSLEHKPEVYEAKFDMIEERVKELRKRVETLDSIKEVLVELKLLTTQQIEANAQRDELLQEHGIALAKAVETLKDLSQRQDSHDSRIQSLEKKSHINLNDLVQKVFYTGVGIVITALLSKVIQ